jgi:hypothetical protein
MTCRNRTGACLHAGFYQARGTTSGIPLPALVAELGVVADMRKEPKGCGHKRWGSETIDNKTLRDSVGRRNPPHAGTEARTVVAPECAPGQKTHTEGSAIGINPNRQLRSSAHQHGSFMPRSSCTTGSFLQDCAFSFVVPPNGRNHLLVDTPMSSR